MSLYDSSQIRVTFVWIFSVSFRSLWKMNEHSWQWALRQRMLLPSFSNHPPIPATAPHWKKKERNFFLKTEERRARIQAEWTTSQPISSLHIGSVIRLGYWGRIHRSAADAAAASAPRYVYVYPCGSVVCVCVCVEAGWNEMPGLGYLQGEPLHPIMWGSQQALWDQEEAASIKGRGQADRAWSNGRGEFLFIFFFK